MREKIVTKDHKQVFAENLSFYMTVCDKSRRDISNDLGISYYTVTDWVNGKKMPRMDKVEKLADYFGVMMSELLEPPVSVASGRLEEAVYESNMPWKKIEKACGFEEGVIKGFLEKTREPDMEELSKLAEVLDVSYMWLLGFDEPKERPLWQKKNDQMAVLFNRLKVDERFFNMVATLSELPDEQYNTVDVILRAFEK